MVCNWTVLMRSSARLVACAVLRSRQSGTGQYNANYGKNSVPRPGRALLAAGIALLAAEVFDEKRLFRAAQDGDIEELERQLRAGGADAARRRHPLGWTVLMVAAANGHTAAVATLLNAGAEPGARDEYAPDSGAAPRRSRDFCAAMNPRASYAGWTALHYAALSDCVECARALLAAGAQVTVRDHAGRRALSYARDPSAVRTLLQEATRQAEIDAAAAAAAERRADPLENRLQRALVGQRAAIGAVSSAVRRKETGWADEEHPLVFLFLGSSGLGKTELAKQLARYVHQDAPHAFIRLDMSEYQERHEVAKLIGAPPGYVGHEEGGQLTRALARRADAVVLLDEVDKAHPDVLTVLLQLFDEGRLTDGKGRLIECKDAIFVMTSNLAADEIADYAIELRREAELKEAAKLGLPPGIEKPAPVDVSSNSGGDGEGEFVDELVDEALNAALPEEPAIHEPELEVSRQFKDQVVRPILKRHFGRDEFLGRIDEIVYFLPFSRQEVLALVARELARWADRARRRGVQLRWEGGALGALADGYEVQYGARSVQHEVARRLAARLALAAERGQLAAGSRVLLRARGGRLRLSVRGPGQQAIELD